LNNCTIENDLEKIDIFGGVCGVYLHSSFFNTDIFNVINDANFSKKYLYADDDFFSLYLKKNKIGVYLVKTNLSTVKYFNEEAHNSNYCLHLNSNQISIQEDCINYMLSLIEKI
jgi:hypothetical protein